MNKEIFKSERYFTVFDFLISHGQLLLRSSKDDNNKKNIDVIFFGAKFIQLFTSLWGISIKIADKDINLISYDSVNSSLGHKENCLFEIEAKTERHYIGASYFKVYENELEFNETSLGLG
ncbi:hypothetical protein [Mucilaginibacter sp. NFX135]|uniref:hypothetical protein n=1 Tax=Mucilaginibacter sp. NFX135 TaxID=3402687 RepID=UPI003AFB4295